MNSNKMQEVCLNNGKITILKIGQQSLLKKNFANTRIISNNNSIQKEISNKNPATEFVQNPSEMQTLASVNFSANQSNDKTYNAIKYSHAVQSNAVETIIRPVQVMPIAFQTAEQNNTITLQMQYTSSIDQKAVGNYTKTSAVSIASAAPSGTKLPTVNHTNRSLVYRVEPVSTNTAPITSFNEINLIDLTKSIPSETFTSNSSAIDQCVEKCFLTNDTLCVTGELLPVPCVNSYASLSKRSVSGANFHTSQVYKQHLQQDHQISTKITANNHYPHVQQYFQQFSEFVSMKCQT